MTQPPGLRRSILISLVLFTFQLPGTVQAAGSPPLWSIQFEHMRWFKETPAGPIVVGAGDEIVGVSPDSGQILWRLGSVKKPDAGDVEVLPESPYVLLSLGSQKQTELSGLSLLDPRDGKIVWRGQALGLSRSISSFIVPGARRLLVLATTLPKDKQRTAALVELESGTALWTNTEFGEAQEGLRYTIGKLEFLGSQVPLQDTDSTMIFHVSRSRFQRYQMKTGRMLWDSADNPAGSLSLGDRMKAGMKDARSFPFQYAPMLASPGSDRFYAPYANTVAAFSLSTGSRLWNDAPKLGVGVVVEARATPEGLLVRTICPGDDGVVGRLAMLDPATGGTVWKSDGLDGCSNFLVESDRLVVAAEGKLRAFSLRGGDETDLAKLGFQDDDDPISLHRSERGYCVVGSSNLGIFAFQNGERLASYYLPSPSGAGLGLLLLGLSALTSSVGPVNAGSGVTVSAGIAPEAGVSELLKDYSQSRQRDRFAYFLASVDGEGAIVRVHRDTGEVSGKIVLGSDQPRYAIDAAGRLLYQDDKLLQSYAFPTEQGR